MEEYKKAVLAHYEAVKDNLHSDFLLYPTTARLRSLCTVLFDSLNADDRVIFTRFFKPDSLDANLSFNDVAKFDIDKFKPLLGFMKSGATPRKAVVIELLAILIDYQPRPLKKFSKVGIKQIEPNNEFEKVDIPQISDYNNGGEKEKEKENIATFNSDRKNEDEEASVEETSIIVDPTEDKPVPRDTTSPQPPPRNYVKMVFVFLLVAIGGGYLAKSDLLKEKGCMIWRQDHYEKVACDYELDPSGGEKIEPVNEQLLKYQRKVKITDATKLFNPDGSSRFFYGKNAEQQMEYFTLPGRHPETGKLLKELSDYMIKKHFVSTGN
ncbi:hypothetical protein [Flavobacterium lindanitolerans]|uniref:hypothetical protein n=1 Tax=Flavobacterium lindanitolerans TaxID=428988 RepID=UPI002809127A|nr:hypothetical protein [Flavobacterium lindanitolerans]MDQ7961736.1 hypothetical protein [Flavobacterium lindanitolerans]